MRKLIIALSIAAQMSMSAAMPVVRWQTLGNTVGADGKPCYTQRFALSGMDGVKRLCFNQFARKMSAVNPADTIAEIVPGYYYIASPRLADKEIDVDIVTVGTLRHHSYMPDGAHAVMADGRVVPVKLVRQKISDRPEQWSLPGNDWMPTAESVYDRNEELAAGRVPSPTDIIPSLKHVEVVGDGKASLASPKLVSVKHKNSEYYKIDLSGDTAVISYASPRALLMANQTLNQLAANYQPDGLPKLVVEDYPDFPYRGIMIDISRNFLPLSAMQKIAQYLAHYRMNTLHFHFADDEAWRLEIPGLPELTDLGSRRGYTTDEHDFLAQIFAGDGNPDTPEGSANGYYTRGEFISFLRYCASLGIDVIPEVESPGHARAAIKAMEARYRSTGDDTYRLIEDGDTSVYTSAQAFHDNAMNPALEGPYRFIEHVVDELKKMYDEAGVELKAVHIGGDEVAKGAWDGAPSVDKMMTDRGLETQTQVHAEFVKRVAAMLASKGIPMNAWREVAIDHSPDYNAVIAPLTGGINFWTTSRTSKAPKAAADGYPVIICNVDHFYLDQCYSFHPEERGLSWGGQVDEFATLNGYPYEMCQVDSAYRDNIRGISGHIFAETIRDFPQVQTYLFPKALGLAERAWNADTTYTDADFNRLIGCRELPSLALRGVDFHLRRPGIKVIDSKIYINSPYPEAVIRYTTDGSNPTAESPVYSAPIDYQPGTQVRASIFYLGHQSLPTILLTRE